MVTQAWRDMLQRWTEAIISDAEFIRLAYSIGRGPRARDIVNKDLDEG